MRTIAMVTFLGSTAMTGAGLALMAWFTVGQAAWLAMIGSPLMLLSGGVTVGMWPSNLDERMAENRMGVLLDRREPRLPVLPPSRNGHSQSWPRTVRQGRR